MIIEPPDPASQNLPINTKFKPQPSLEFRHPVIYLRVKRCQQSRHLSSNFLIGDLNSILATDCTDKHRFSESEGSSAKYKFHQG
jgi:hypothetical protein